MVGYPYNYGDNLDSITAQANFNDLIDSLRTNKIFYLGILIIPGFRIFVPFHEIPKILADSCYVNLCADAITKRSLKLLLEELQQLPGCEVVLQNLHQILENSEVGDQDKQNHAELVLGTIDKMTNLDLKNGTIVCFVLTLTNLYFSNLIGFDILINALINALNKGKLSSRIFHLILRMLTNRGIPIKEILEAVE